MKFKLNEITFEGQPTVTIDWQGINIDDIALTDIDESLFMIQLINAYELKHGKEKTQEVILIGME